MLETLIELSILIAGLACVYGWGAFTQLALGANEELSLSYRAILGFALLIFIGGILNSFALATITNLNILAALGLCLCLGSGFYERQKIIETIKQDKHFLVARISLFLLISTLLSLSILPSEISNFHDDFHSYFPRIEFMLATGSLSGNPYSLVGADSLGAQTYAQAFIVGNFGFQFIHAFDTVFCIALSMLAMLAIAKRLNCSALTTLLATSTLLLIHTQQVNSSSVYSTTLLILGLNLGLIELLKTQDKFCFSALAISKRMLPLILVLQSLIAIKTLSAFYAAFAFLTLYAVLISNQKLHRKEITVGFLLSGFTLILVTLPWLTLHIENFSSMLYNPSEGTVSAEHLFNLELHRFISLADTGWGNSIAPYTTLILVLVASLSWLCLFRKKTSGKSDPAIVSSGAALLTLLLSLSIFEFLMAIRYFIPILLGCLGVAILYVFGTLKTSSAEGEPNTSSRNKILGTIGLACLFALFYPANSNKIDKLPKYKSLLAFDLNPAVSDYSRYIWSQSHQGFLDKLQGYTEENKRIFSWTSAAFLFDFYRNNISNFAATHTLAPWYELHTKSPQQIKNELVKRGYKYIIWQYEGTGMRANRELQNLSKNENIMWRQFGSRTLDLKGKLTQVAKDSLILVNTQGYILIDITSAPLRT